MRDDDGDSTPGYSDGFRMWLAAAVLLAGLALVLFVKLPDEAPGRISETRCHRVVQAMVATGDWLVPRVGTRLRLEKPPLFYWAGALTASALADSRVIAVRLPSALAALGLLALVIAWGKSLGGGGLALASGAALVAMIQFASSGRRGDAEMLLALLCSAALLAFERLHQTRRRALLPVFGLLLGLAILTKATAVLPIVVLPILVFLALRRELPLLLDRGWIGAFALALAVGLSWYAAILALVPGAFESLWKDLILPLGAPSAKFAGSAHYRAPWWYLGVLPVGAAPASLLLPVIAWRLWSTRLYRETPRMRFIALSFVVSFLAFSLLPQKQRHYTLVMLPSLALLCGEALLALEPRARALLARLAGAPLALAGIGGVTVLALFQVWIEGSSPIGVGVAAGALGSVFGVALLAALRGRTLAFALAFVPAFLLTLAAERSVSVRVELMQAQGVDALTLDERERVYRVAREQPWMIELFQVTRRDD